MSKIFFLMWVSGSGKTTVLNTSGILDRDDIKYVQSYTTRPLREGEINGVKYFHIRKEEFQKDIDAGDFLEYATVHQTDFYGTKYSAMVRPLEQWISTIKEIEMFWLEKIQQEGKIDGRYITIFLDIPDEVMKERIRGREEIAEEYLEKRLYSAEFEREKARERCDYIIDASQPLENVVEAFLDIMGKELDI